MTGSGEGDRVRTGIQVLDERLKGGFPRPSTLLLFSDKPTEKRLFAENFAVQGASAGETTLYVDFFRAPTLARAELSRFGKYPADHLVMVDAISSQLMVDSSEAYRIKDIDDLQGICDVIVQAIQEQKPSRIVIDSMEFLADHFHKEAVLDQWKRIIDEAERVRGVTCFLFINWTYHERDLSAIRALSDFVVEFQSSMRGGILRNSMRISEMEEGGIFEVADVALEVIHTPGHSPGSVSLYCEELGAVFSGDALLADGPGLHEGDFPDFARQLSAIGEGLLALPEETRVLPGHGDETTIKAAGQRFDSWASAGPRFPGMPG